MDSIAINIRKAAKSRLAEVNFNELPFGRVFTDHMFSAEYSDGEWKNFEIVPYGKISFTPALTALHYGQSLFEGFKAFKDPDGFPLIFRPEQNLMRLNRSARRMAMPEVPTGMFMEAVKTLVSVDSDWIPKNEGASLYIRPIYFACDESVGIHIPTNYRFYILLCSVGPYFARPIRVLVADKYVRTVEGGVGAAKVAGNYGATMLALKEAQQAGFDQVLWTRYPDFNYVQEVGAMNMFFVIDGVAVTPSSRHDDILDGVTRNSIIELLKTGGKKVEERDISMDEILAAHAKGHLNDMFGTGTAATILHVTEFGYKGKVYQLPSAEERELSHWIRTKLESIRRGLAPDEFGWMERIQLPQPVSQA